MAGGRGQPRDQPPSAGDVAYVLPRHPAEVDRLDVQHYALLATLRAHYLAPVRMPASILDVGAGTGQWAYDLCVEFPESRVVGFDLVPPKPQAPNSYRHVRGNLLQGLPFIAGGFDFVHQRLLMLAVPVRSWSGVMDELVRVLAPGGWLELVEGNVEFASSGPATDQLAELLRRLARSSGIDSTGHIFRSLQDHLTQRGLSRVQRRTFPIPVGDWGGRIGSMFASDCRAMYLRLADVFEARFAVTAAECHDLVSRAQREWEERHTTYSFAVAFGQKKM